MEVLCYIEQEQLLQMVSFAIESQLSVQVTEVQVMADAMSVLMDDREIDLLVLEDNIQAIKLLKYFSSIESKIPIIFVGGGAEQLVSAFPDLQLKSVVRPPDVVGKIVDLVRKTLNEKPAGPGPNPDFVRVRIEVLLKVLPLLSDAYIRLSDIKYVKMFKEGTNFDGNEVQRSLKKKGVRYLYLKKTEISEFLSRVKVEIDKLTHMTERVDQDSSLDITQGTHELVMELSDRLGFTKEVQEIAKKNVELTLNRLGSHPKLNKILELVGRDPRQYISSHSVVVAHLACSLARIMGWPSETTFAKLTFAAYFHDFSLRNENLAKVQSLAELDSSPISFSEKDRADFKNHPLAGSQVIQHFAEIPPDVDTVIMQHHERPDGKGFPRGLTAAQIAPLSSIFIVAHDMANYFAKVGKSGDLNGFIQSVQDLYSARHFKQIVQKLKGEVTDAKSDFAKVGS